MNKFLLTLLIILIHLNLSKSYNVGSEILSCEGDKPKSKKACAVINIDDISKDIISLHIRSDCDDDELCYRSGVSENPYMMQCIKKVEAKKVGKKCHYNGDCITNICSNNKCAALIEGQTCDDSYVQCGPGLTCSESENKCTKLSTEGQKCQRGKIYCDFGLECNYNVNECQKIGSLEIGQECGGNEMLCKTGSEYDGVCVNVTSDGVCKKQSDGSVLCDSLRLGNIDYNNDLYCNDYAGDPDVETNYGCPLSVAKVSAFKKYYDKLEDIDLKDYQNKKNFLYDEGTLRYTFGKKTMMKYYVLSKYSGMFKARGLITDKAKHVKGKNCEYKFLIKALGHNSSGFLKLKIFLGMVLSLILF